jgi:hypothetical protein
MTIQEKLNEIIELDQIEVQGIETMMLEFAKFCCEEQKKVCAESATIYAGVNATDKEGCEDVGKTTKIFDSWYHTTLFINEDSILNCKNIIS